MENIISTKNEILDIGEQIFDFGSISDISKFISAELKQLKPRLGLISIILGIMEDSETNVEFPISQSRIKYVPIPTSQINLHFEATY